MVDSYGDRIIYLMRMVSTAHGQWLDVELRKHALNRAKWGALSQLAYADPEALSGATLGRRSAVTAQSMSAALADLLERQLVARAPNPDHGRILDVRITPAGRDVVGKVQVRMRALEKRAVASLTDAEAETMRTSLRTMMTDLDLYVPPRD